MDSEKHQEAVALRSEQDVIQLFSGYSTLAIMANSSAVDLEAVQRRLPPDTLFIFFTHCNKVLSSPFGRDAVILHRMRNRSIPMNSNEAREEARNLFEPAHLKGEIGLYASLATAGTPAPSRDREPVPFAVVDAEALFAGFYTRGQRPSSGFALAVWLIDRLPGKSIVLCGFTGVRDGSLKMSSMHDWTLEQTVLRVFYREGRLIRFEAMAGYGGSISRISKAFPAFSKDEVALVALQVVSERAEALGKLAAILQDVLRPLLRVSEKLRRRAPGNKF